MPRTFSFSEDSLTPGETLAIESKQDTANSYLSTLAGGVSGTHYQVDVLTMPSVTVDSEFPTAAAITDNFTNPTTTSVMAMVMGWDGSAWDRISGDSTNGLTVNLGANNDVTVTGTVTANAGTDLNTSLLALESGGNLATLAAKDFATETTLQTVSAKLSQLAGTGACGTVALAATNTWYQVPAAGSVPAQSYVLVVSKENADGTIRFGFGNSSIPSATYGNRFVSKDIVFELGGNTVVYFGSTNAGDDVNWTTKII